MCSCGKPTVNGEFGYRWQPSNMPSIHPIQPPVIEEGDVLLYDSPGRCGRVDSHCHHYRVVRHGSFLFLLIQHGGGREKMRLGNEDYFASTLAVINETERYWLLNGIYRAIYHATGCARQTTEYEWRSAIAENRVRRRKQRGQARVTVTIEPRSSLDCAEGQGGTI
jgi:hypothetical protein